MVSPHLLSGISKLSVPYSFASGMLLRKIKGYFNTDTAII